jgi:hypothetical protein
LVNQFPDILAIDVENLTKNTQILPSQNPIENYFAISKINGY